MRLDRIVVNMPVVMVSPRRLLPLCSPGRLGNLTFYFAQFIMHFGRS